MNNKKINVTKPSLPTYHKYCEEIKSIWDTSWLTNNGEKLQSLEKLITKKTKSKNVSLLVNGHQALEAALEALNLPKGSEIITTPFTFISTTNAIVRKGYIPIFCDINENDFTIDVTKIEKLINKNTSAILPVHVYGNLCDINKIEKIAKNHHLKVLYDAAHAFGVKYKNVDSANFGDFSMFSFHATKVFNTIEGGALCYKNKSYKKIINKISDFGITDGKEDIDYIGSNMKMNEFQAAMGICNLKTIDNNIKKRKVIAQRYDFRLGKVKGIRINKKQKNVKSNYAYYPIVFENYKYSRDEIFKKLRENNINTRKYFYPIANECSSMKKYKNNKTPIAKKISKSILTLPIYPDLTLQDVDKICDLIIF